MSDQHVPDLVVEDKHIQEAIDLFRQHFPKHPELSQYSDTDILLMARKSLAESQNAARDLSVNLWVLQDNSLEGFFDSCPYAIGVAIFDGILMTLGFANLHLPPGWGGAKQVTNGIGKAVEKTLPLWSKLVTNAASAYTSKTATVFEKAVAYYPIVSNAWTAGMFGSIITSIFSDMEPLDWMIAGVCSFATIITLVASGGAAFYAALALQFFAVTACLKAVINAVEVCGAHPPEPEPEPEPHHEVHEILRTELVGGRSGRIFADNLPDKALILGVIIHSGEHVSSIQTLWTPLGAPLYGEVHGSEKGDKHVIQFSLGEGIRSITGYHGDLWINQITIKTTKGVYGPFGGGGGVPFELNVAPRLWVFGFYGRSSQYLNQIGFLCRYWE